MSLMQEGVEPAYRRQSIFYTQPTSSSHSAVKPQVKKPSVPEDTLPTPRPSLDKEGLFSKVVDVCGKVASGLQQKAVLEDVSKGDFAWIQQRGESGEIDGWESTRIDFMGSTMIVMCPTWQHESLSNVVNEALRKQSVEGIRYGGSPDLELLNNFGTKCPDLVLCDSKSDRHAGFPTVAFEVGYSQPQAALNYNAARLLFGSGGKINVVVTVKVSTEGGKVGYLGVDVWRMIPDVVEEGDMRDVPYDTILMKNNKVASPKILSWFFSCLSQEDGVLFNLKTKVRHYQVHPPAGDDLEEGTPPAREGPVLLKGTDLFRFDNDSTEPNKEVGSLRLEFNQLLKSFQDGLLYQQASKDKNRLSSADVKNQYLLKRALATLDSDDEEKNVAKEGPRKKMRQ